MVEIILADGDRITTNHDSLIEAAVDDSISAIRNNGETRIFYSNDLKELIVVPQKSRPYKVIKDERSQKRLATAKGYERNTRPKSK